MGCIPTYQGNSVEFFFMLLEMVAPAETISRSIVTARDITFPDPQFPVY